MHKHLIKPSEREFMKYHVHINRKQYIGSLVFLFLLIIMTIVYILMMPRWTEASPLLFPDCMFKQTFHLYCPGCGGTRAIEALLNLQPLVSFLYHPMIIYIVIWLGFFYIKIGIQIKKQKGLADFYISLLPLWGLPVLLILFFFMRNLLLVYCNVDFIGELGPYWHP